MQTRVAEMLGIDVPIFGFSHCRDVVAAVSNAGGCGVLGAVAHRPEQLDIDLPGSRRRPRASHSGSTCWFPGTSPERTRAA